MFDRKSKPNKFDITMIAQQLAFKKMIVKQFKQKKKLL